ncbi:MAG: signal recognition particle-docking protein FtsY [Actinobacteria bacterium]|nr:MAG: signal recognition particle-docking protein FtsY [Actinomycetota bacterium]
MALFNRFKDGLKKSREKIGEQLSSTFKLHPRINEELWESLEEILISADVGSSATLKITDSLREKAKKQKISDSSEIKNLLINEIESILASPGSQILKNTKQIILVLGVNGSGKTTTIGKLASRTAKDGHKLVLAAADTFRAAAIEQLQIWADRAGADLVKHERGSDPAAVVFDSIKAAFARQADFLIADTAGRLHTQTNLMEELKKIKRVAAREAEDWDIKTLLVIDANTGQNAIAQTDMFNQAIGVDEIALTKLDGTAKGGIVIAIVNQFHIPVSYAGLGEKIEDLEVFNPKNFAKAIVGS